MILKIYYLYQCVNINRVAYVNICESRNTETKITFVLICCIILLQISSKMQCRNMSPSLFPNKLKLKSSEQLRIVKVYIIFADLQRSPSVTYFYDNRIFCVTERLRLAVVHQQTLRCAKATRHHKSIKRLLIIISETYFQ